MSAMEVRRSVTKSAAPVIPRSLLKKQEPTLLERLWCYWDAVGMLAVFLMVPGILFEANTSGTTNDLIGAVLIAIPVFFAIVCLSVVIWRSDEVGDDWDAKRKAIKFDRNRRYAPHAAERLARRGDIEYAQYSTSVERQGDEIVVEVIKHERGEWGYRWQFHTREIFDFEGDTGTWGSHEHKRLRITKPTLANVDKAVREVSEIAAELERKSYAEALERKQLDRLVLIMAPPSSGSKERAEHWKDELDTGKDDLLLTEET